MEVAGRALGVSVESSFVPVGRMLERVERGREESDTAYFFDLLYLGEMLLKLLAVEALAGLQDDRENHRYAQEYRLVRADGLGEYADVIDETYTGPASHHLVPPARESQRAVTENHLLDDSSWQSTAVRKLDLACRRIDPERADLGRKVSLRNWIRDFVWLRNRTRGHGATRPETASTLSPLLAESVMAVVAGAPLFDRPWAYLRRSLSGKFRVTGFGGNRDEFAYLTRETDHALEDGAYVILDGPRRARLLFTNADLDDFYLPNGNYRRDSYEAFSYITDDRIDEDGSAYALPAYARPRSETATSGQLEVVGELFSNMPPRRPGYVARRELEAQLAELLRDDRYPVITMQGRGGVGKTSTALQVLHDIALSHDFFGIVWFSARDMDLLTEGPRVVRADVLSTDDVARDFATLLAPHAKMSIADARAMFADYLCGNCDDGPFIFVLDNFETVRDPLELYTFLSNTVRLPNKVLITTRTRQFKADYPVEVGAMTREEYSVLVDRVAANLAIRHLIDGPYEDRLYEESDGHPYITKVLLGEVAQEGKKLSPRRVVASKDAMLDALFDRSFAALSPTAQRMFLTICSWRSLVPVIGLEAVLLRPANQRLNVEQALTELTQSALVEIIEDPNSGTPFISAPLAAAQFGKRKLVTSPMKIAIDADLELIRSFGVTATTDLAQGLGPRLDRVIRSVAGKAADGADVSQELAVIEYIASSYPPAWLRIAELQQELGRNDLAVDAANRFVQSDPRDPSGWRRLIALYRDLEDPLAEMHARLQLAELVSPPYSDLSQAANRINGLLSRQELDVDVDERRLMVHRLRRLMEDRAKEADATDLSRLAWLCMHDGDTTAAERWANAGLAQDPDNRHCQSLIARLN